jgi:integrase
MKKKLTAKYIEHLNVDGPRRLDVWDSVLQGFGVRASPGGRKTWFVIIRPHGRARRMTIGTYPAIQLADARDTAAKIIRGEQLGQFDQHEEKRTQTLRETVPQFIQMYARPKNRRWKTSERVLWKFEVLFDLPIDQIKRTDVVRVLDSLLASGMKGGANRALSSLKKLMNWALDRGVISVNPITGLKPPSPENSRDRVLTDAELTQLLRAAQEEGYPFGDLLRVLTLTGQRRGEVADMRWSEIDMDGTVWHIPGARTKNRLSHDVPLTRAVIEMLRYMPRFSGSDFVFTTTGNTPVSGFGRAKERVVDGLGFPDWRLHDLRRSAASGMARLGVAPHVIERVLNHKSGIISGVAAVYNRYGYEKEKRDALEIWGNHLASLTKQPNETTEWPGALPIKLGSHSERQPAA